MLSDFLPRIRLEKLFEFLKTGVTFSKERLFLHLGHPGHYIRVSTEVKRNCLQEGHWGDACNVCDSHVFSGNEVVFRQRRGLVQEGQLFTEITCVWCRLAQEDLGVLQIKQTSFIDIILVSSISYYFHDYYFQKQYCHYTYMLYSIRPCSLSSSL